MKLASGALPFSLAVLLCVPLTLPARAAVQTKKHVHHRSHRRTTRKVASKAAGCASEPGTTISALIPKVSGCPATLYALRYVDTVTGTGAAAAPHKYLTVNYTGYLTDGTKFDTSVGKQPINFPYGAHRVITGWDTGFEGMKVGGKRRLYIPYQLAYGAAGKPPVIPPKAELIFDVELLGVDEAPSQPGFSAPHPTQPAQPARQPAAQPTAVPPPTTTAPTTTAPATTNPPKP